MFRKTAFLITILALLITFSACSQNENKKNNKDNTAISEKEETTSESEAEITEPATDEITSVSETPDISFSESKSKFIGSFYSQIYGNLKLYLQEGYFLLIDEYDEMKFTVFANNYSYNSDSSQLPIFDDMNFDSHTDFAVCYAEDGENLYYYCFLWDSEEKNYVYYNPLSSLANPVFDSENCQIISNYKKTKTEIREDIYIFNGSQLTLAFTKDIEIAPGAIEGPEIINSELEIMENGNSALISLKSKKETHSKWTCYIDDENTVSLTSEYYDESNLTYEFLLSAVSKGSTTVIFRYETFDTGEYIEERIINVTVDANNNVKVIIPGEYFENEETTEELTEKNIPEE